MKKSFGFTMVEVVVAVCVVGIVGAVGYVWWHSEVTKTPPSSLQTTDSKKSKITPTISNSDSQELATYSDVIYRGQSYDGQIELSILHQPQSRSQVVTVRRIDSSKPIVVWKGDLDDGASLSYGGTSNWSTKLKYVYVEWVGIESDDIFVFHSDGSLFPNKQTFLTASSLGYSRAPITSVLGWINDTQILLPEGGPVATEYPTYIFDVDKETLTKK